MTSEIREKVLDFISRHYGIPKENVDPEGSLVDQGAIDSLGYVEIVLFLEAEFSIVIASGQINRENFDSVTRIVDFITAAQTALRAREPPLAG